MFNQTEVREFHFIVNGKYKLKNKMTSRRLFFVIHRCAGGKCPVELIEDIPCEDRVRYWSEPSDWKDDETDTTVYPPIEGEDVRIKSGWNMIYDVAFEEGTTVPITYNKVEINGCLTFDSKKDHHFKAKIIYLRQGRLEIGSKANRYVKKATIELVGEKEAEAIAL